MMRDRHLMRCLTVLMAFVWTVSCYRTKTETRTRTIKVNTDPPGAKVWVGDESGKKLLGTSPTSFHREYDVRVKEFSRWSWLLTALPVAPLGVGIGGLMMTDGGSGRAFAISMLSLGCVGIVALPITFGILKASGIEELPSEKPQRITVGAILPGYQPDSANIDVANASNVNLMLQPAKSPAVTFAPAAPAIEGESGPGPRREIVAVFDIHDATGRLKKKTLVQLTNYLGTVLAQTGSYSTIPREQLRSRLFEKKKGSYKECYDERCQIELGKAVAAQKTLATTLIRVGSKCAVTANLFDLKTETAVKGASVNTGCSPDELLDAMKQIAEQLAGK